MRGTCGYYHDKRIEWSANRSSFVITHGLHLGRWLESISFSFSLCFMKKRLKNLAFWSKNAFGGVTKGGTMRLMNIVSVGTAQIWLEMVWTTFCSSFGPFVLPFQNNISPNRQEDHQIQRKFVFFLSKTKRMIMLSSKTEYQLFIRYSKLKLHICNSFSLPFLFWYSLERVKTCHFWLWSPLTYLVPSACLRYKEAKFG